MSNKFYIENVEQLFACFRCGEIMGDIHESELGHGYICESCGENSIVTITNALDMINDMYIKGDLTFNSEEVEIDYDYNQDEE